MAAQRGRVPNWCRGHAERVHLRRLGDGRIDVDRPKLSIVDVGAIVGLVAVGGDEQRPELVVERGERLVVPEEEASGIGRL